LASLTDDALNSAVYVLGFSWLIGVHTLFRIF
jgi:hypothetical protein